MLEFPQGLMHSSENKSERTREAEAHCPLPERSLSPRAVVMLLLYLFTGPENDGQSNRNTRVQSNRLRENSEEEWRGRSSGQQNQNKRFCLRMGSLS